MLLGWSNIPVSPPPTPNYIYEQPQGATYPLIRYSFSAGPFPLGQAFVPRFMHTAFLSCILLFKTSRGEVSESVSDRSCRVTAGGGRGGGGEKWGSFLPSCFAQPGVS